MFTYNCHVTPLRGRSEAWKEGQTISDASYRPSDWATGVNDWTNKDEDLPVEFQLSECLFFREVYNYGISSGPRTSIPLR